jgi:hypothetical protein
VCWSWVGVVDGQDIAGSSRYRPRSDRVRPVLARQRSGPGGNRAAQRGQRKQVAYHRRARLSRRLLRAQPHADEEHSIWRAEPTSRRTVRSEGRDPLYGRRRLLAWPADGHPSSIPPDSAGRPPGPRRRVRRRRGASAVIGRQLAGGSSAARRRLVGGSSAARWRGAAHGPAAGPAERRTITLTRTLTAPAGGCRHRAAPRVTGPVTRPANGWRRGPDRVATTPGCVLPARVRTTTNPVGRLDRRIALTHLLCGRHSPRNLPPVGATVVLDLAISGRATHR